MRHRLYRDDLDSALVSGVMVIPGSSDLLQIADHTLIDVPLANVYLDSPYNKDTVG